MDIKFKKGMKYRLHNGNIAECLNIFDHKIYPVQLLRYGSPVSGASEMVFVSLSGKAKNENHDVIAEYDDGFYDEELSRQELRLTYRDEADGLIYLVNDKELEKLTHYKLRLRRHPCALDETDEET
jgi:hypothetical protein